MKKNLQKKTALANKDFARRRTPDRTARLLSACIAFLLIIASTGINAQCPVATPGTTNNGGILGSISNLPRAIDGNLNTAATINSGLFLTNVSMSVNLDKPANPGDTVYVYYSIPTVNLINWGALGTASFEGHASTNGGGSVTGSTSSSTIGFIIQLGQNSLARLTFVVNAPTNSVKVTFTGISFANNANPGVTEIGVVPGPPTGSATTACYNTSSTITVTKATAAGNTTIIELYKDPSLSASGKVATQEYTASSGTSNNVLTYTTDPLTASTTYYAVQYTKGCTAPSTNVEYSPSVVTKIPVTVKKINPNMTISCQGSTRVISLAPSGGSGNYTYNWTSPAASTASSMPINANGNYSVTITDAAGCSFDTTVAITGYQPGTCEITLPVSIAYFNAAVENKNDVLLKWGTASEQNLKSFVIERSIDGVNWSNLHQEASKSPSGNSSTALQYTYKDLNVPSGTNYYRLSEVNMSGKQTHLPKVISVTISGAEPIGIYPNPVTNDLHIRHLPSGATVVIYDANGKQLLTSHESSIHLKSIQSGIYFLTIIENGRRIQTLKFIKK